MPASPTTNSASPDEALSWAVRRHTREAGVRELDRVIGRVASKRARQVVQAEGPSTTVTVDDLPELLGPDKFKTDRQRENMAPGVAPGLAYTEAGGDVLYVEATLTHKDDKTITTGHLGKVMMESIQAARSYIWSVAERLNIDRNMIEENGIHVHVRLAPCLRTVRQPGSRWRRRWHRCTATRACATMSR